MNSSEYVDSACSIITSTIGQALKNRKTKGSIKIGYGNGRRDIDLRTYSQGLSFKISKGGDINIVFSEFCHDDVVINYGIYSENVEKQSNCLADLQTVASTLMQDFCSGCMDWHIVLDYLSNMKEGDDWKKTYESARVI